MKIIDNRKIASKVEFKTLRNGEVFEYGGFVFMAIKPIENTLGPIVCNAVTMANGLPKLLNSYDVVSPLCCHLVIEDI